MATQVIPRLQWNSTNVTNEDNATFDERMYKTPSGHGIPNTKDYLLAPKKKKGKVTRLRLASSDCPIRKRLDFDCIQVDSCKKTSTNNENLSLPSDKKRKPNRDLEFADLLSGTNAVRSLEEMQITSGENVSKKMKLDVCGNEVECSSSLTPEKSPRKEEDKKNYSCKDADVPISAKEVTEKNVSQKDKDDEERTSDDWEYDFFTPVADASYRSGPKPEGNHSVTKIKSMSDVNEIDDMVKKKALETNVSDDCRLFTTGLKRSKSARSLKFL